MERLRVITTDFNSKYIDIVNMNVTDFIPIAASGLVAIVLYFTYRMNSKNITRQEEMNFKNITRQEHIDLAKLYLDFDGRLRETELKMINDEKATTPQIYHNMMKIIITLNLLVYLKEEKKMDFDIKYFKGWFSFGMGIAEHVGKFKNMLGITSMEEEEYFKKHFKKYCNEKLFGVKFDKKNRTELPRRIFEILEEHNSPI